MIRLVLILLLVLVTIFVLSWTHVLPGGWFLRDLVEDPAHRAARQRAAHRSQRLKEFRETSQDFSLIDHPVVFLGSSTVERFPTDLLFPGGQVINRGIGGEKAGELLERLEVSLPPDVWRRASGVLLYGGSIDFRQDRESIAVVRRRVGLVVAKLKALAPKATILVAGILPGRGSETRASGPLLRELNQTLLRFAAQEEVPFIQLAKAPLIDTHNRLAHAMSIDDWHLNEAGYEVLSRWLRSEGSALSSFLN